MPAEIVKNLSIFPLDKESKLRYNSLRKGGKPMLVYIKNPRGEEAIVNLSLYNFIKLHVLQWWRVPRKGDRAVIKIALPTD